MDEVEAREDKEEDLVSAEEMLPDTTVERPEGGIILEPDGPETAEELAECDEDGELTVNKGRLEE